MDKCCENCKYSCDDGDELFFCEKDKHSKDWDMSCDEFESKQE